MTRRQGAMHVATTRRKYKDTIYETHLLRRSYREDGKVKSETLANLSHLPAESLDLVRGSLAGKAYIEVDENVTIERSLPHGHAAAVGAMAKKLKLAELLGPPCPERDVVMGLIIARICNPASKLATTSWFNDTTVGPDLDLSDLHTDVVYDAMDWLYERQGSIERGLAKRHLQDGGFALYDLSSSWMEGVTCTLSARGHSRDGKSGKLQIEYGLLTDPEGRPVSIEVFDGNTGDPTAFISAVDKVREDFGLEYLAMVGDRGMITQARIDELKKHTTLDWVSALKAPQIQSLLDGGAFQMSLFDKINIAEITHPDYPDERLVLCHNKPLARKRSLTRESMLKATEEKLAKIQKSVRSGRISGKDDIGVAVGKVIGSHKMAKHFVTTITNKTFKFERNQANIDREARTDGLYIVRTSIGEKRLKTNQVVDTYKSLANVERDFRSIKVDDLDMRPIRHWLEERVRAHVFIVMLAAYVVWHLREAWAPITFKDETPLVHDNPVVPKQRSGNAKAKAANKVTDNGDTVRSFQGVLEHLGTLTRNVVSVAGNATVDIVAIPTPDQRKAFELIGLTQVPRTVM
jgi:transposase